MRRGTTPTLTITLSGILVADLKTIKVTFQQGTITLTKNTDEVVVDKEYNTISVYLTQEETLRFKSGTVSVQIRGLLADGTTAIASQIKTISMEKILLEGIIENDNIPDGGDDGQDDEPIISG